MKRTLLQTAASLLLIGATAQLAVADDKKIFLGGYGGSFGFADRDAGLSVGYVMNRMGANLAGDPRTLSLIEAVYASL